MRVLILSILVVAVTTALLVWGSLRAAGDVERIERDPKRLRRSFLRWGFFYVAIAVLTIVRVATGSLPPIALINLPIAAGLAYLFAKHASIVKDPSLLVAAEERY